MTTEELQVIISAQISDLQKKLDKAQKETKGFSEESGKHFEKFNKAVAGVGKATVAAMKVVGGAIVAAGAALVGLGESTKEYRVAQAKLNTAFETAGSTAEQAKTTYNELYRVLGDSDTAVEAANHLAMLTTEEEALAEYTKICQGVYAQFGDSLAIEGLTEAVNHTAKLGEVQGTLADALEWSGVSVDEFNEQLFWCNTEAEREALIRNTLNDLYSESAENYEKNAESILASNEAQAALTESLAQLGAVAEPIVTIFKQGLADALQVFTPHIKTLADGLQMLFSGDVEGGAEKISSGISSIVNTISDVLIKALPTIVTIGVELIGSLIKGILSAMPQLLGSITQAINMILLELPNLIKMVVDMLPTLIRTLTDSIVSLVPTLITCLVDVIVLLCESFDSIIQPLIDSFPAILIAIIDGLMSNLDKLIGGLITLVIGIVRSIPKILESLVNALPTVISMIIDGLLSNLPLLIAGLLTVAVEIAKSLPSILKSVVVGVINVFSGIWDGLGKVFGKVGEWFKEKFGSGVTGIKNAFSSVVSFFTGIWNKIKNIFSKVGSAIGDAIKGAVSKAVNAVLSTAVKIINGFIKAINVAIGVINVIPGVNIKKINELSVPKMAKGGIVDSATLAVIGEQGKEAVMPLENNLEWLDKLANMLTERLGGVGGNAPIVLTVDKRVLAETTASGINDITKRTGKIPLVLV